MTLLLKDKIDQSYIIAEIAQAHEGSLGMAHSYIDAAAEAGADAVKFQCHIADAESTVDEDFRIKMSTQDKNRYEYWKRMEFTSENWDELINHSKEKSIDLICSVFSNEAVDMLLRKKIKAWKLGSGEVFNTDLNSKLLKTDIPIIASSGMSTWDDIDKIYNLNKKHSSGFYLMHCCSKYPTPLEEIGLNIFDEMKIRYDCEIGVSDHSGNKFSSIYAIANNVNLLEVHVTFDKKMYGPDVSSSITFSELKEIVDFSKVSKILKTNKISKDEIANSILGNKSLFTKSISLKHDLKAGDILREDHIKLKKPGTGISPDRVSEIIGRKLVRDVSKKRLLKFKDLK